VRFVTICNGRLVVLQGLRTFVTAGTRPCKPCKRVLRAEQSHVSVSELCYGRSKPLQALRSSVPAGTRPCKPCNDVLRPEHGRVSLSWPCSDRNKALQAVFWHRFFGRKERKRLGGSHLRTRESVKRFFPNMRAFWLRNAGKLSKKNAKRLSGDFFGAR
jgi:hypothetical protein